MNNAKDTNEGPFVIRQFGPVTYKVAKFILRISEFGARIKVQTCAILEFIKQLLRRT